MRHKKARPAEFAGEWRWLKKIAGGFGHAILIISSERFWRRLAARFVAVLEQLTLGASPVLERISGRTTALQKNLVGAQGDLFRCRMDPGCARLRYCWRRTFPRPGHTRSFRSTTLSMLQLMESHRFRIHGRANRKIQWFESKNRNSSDLRNRDQRAVKLFVCPRAGTTPSCCIMPKVSQLV